MSSYNFPSTSWRLSSILLLFLCFTQQSYTIYIKNDTPTKYYIRQAAVREKSSEGINASCILKSQCKVQTSNTPVQEKIDPYSLDSLIDDSNSQDPPQKTQMNEKVGEVASLQVTYGGVGAGGVIGIVFAIIFGPWILAFLFGFFCAVLDTSGRRMRNFWTDIRNMRNRRRNSRQERQVPGEADQNLEIFFEGPFHIVVGDPSKSKPSLTVENLSTFFPQVKFEDLKSSFSQTICSVCLETLVPEADCHQLPCEHIFHCECIQLWLKNQLQKNKACCPNCNVDVNMELASRQH